MKEALGQRRGKIQYWKVLKYFLLGNSKLK